MIFDSLAKQKCKQIRVLIYISSTQSTTIYIERCTNICLLIFMFDYQSKLNFVFKYKIFPNQSTRDFGRYILQASLRAHDVGIPFPTLCGENPLETSCANTLITFNISQGYHAYGNIVEQ